MKLGILVSIVVAIILTPGSECFFDPCQAFGLCLVVQPARPSRRFTSSSPVNFKKLDDKWITPMDYTSEYAYYFPQDIFNGYDWFEAKKFCESNGGYLAEPKRGGDANFIRSYARSLGNNNWWLGLREKEQCHCQSTSSNQIFSSILQLSPSELVNQMQLRLNCPSYTRKVCNSLISRWVWSNSGTPVAGYSDWGPSEPHYGEYCVVLWQERDFQWSDFSCNSRIDANNAKYKPLCQKSIAPPATATTTTTTTTSTTTTTTPAFNDYEIYDTAVEEDEDEEEEENRFSQKDVLPSSRSCLDSNVIYRGRNLQRPIKNVYSSKRCAQICHSMEACKFWVWRGDKFPQKCILKSKLRRRRFRVRKRAAVSGKKEGCESNVAKEDPTPCSISHDVKVDNVETIRNYFGMPNPDDCRDKCMEMRPLCKTWSWVRLHRREPNSRRSTKCILSATSSEAEDYFVYKKGAVTGIYPGESCYSEKKLGDKCSCKSFAEDYYDEVGDYDDYSEIDLSGSGRIRNSGEEEEDSVCEKKTEYRYCPLGEEESSSKEIMVEKLENEEVCIEIGVNFNGGATYSMLEGVASAELCREKCNGICKYWTWKSHSSVCLLKSSNTYYPEANVVSVSGRNIGSCSPDSAPYSSLTRCACLAVDPEYDYPDGGEEEEYTDEEYEASEEADEDDFLSLITVKAGGKSCSGDLVKKCGVRTPSVNILELGGSSRINFS